MVQTVPSAFMRPELTPGGQPYFDEQHVLHIVDAKTAEEIARLERLGKFSSGREWLRAAMAAIGMPLPQDMLSVWYFPWAASLTEPDGTEGRWKFLHNFIKPFLTPERVEALRPYMRRLVLERLREEVAEQREAGNATGVIDMSAFAGAVSFNTISYLLGFPHGPADELFMQTHLDDIAARTDPMDTFKAEPKVVGKYFDCIIADDRNLAEGSLLAAIVEAHRLGQLTRKERDGLIMGCWSAGRDTTATGLVLLFGLLDEADMVPTMLANLDSDGREWRGGAVNEALRFTPFPSNPLTATQDVTLECGLTVRRLGGIELHWDAINRDPALCGANGGVFDPGRNAHHKAFGHGMHYCLGRHLAKVEIDEVAVLVYRYLLGLRLKTWRRKAGFIDDVEATFEYDVAASAAALGLL